RETPQSVIVTTDTAPFHFEDEDPLGGGDEEVDLACRFVLVAAETQTVETYPARKVGSGEGREESPFGAALRGRCDRGREHPHGGSPRICPRRGTLAEVTAFLRSR